MTDDFFLTHYFTKGALPFRSLSALPDCDAIRLMQALYVEGSVLWERFKDPAGYLRERRETEQWVREQFVLRGGHPREVYPIYTVLGSSPWVVAHADPSTHAEIQISLSIFSEDDVSFTYPDSMISHWFGRDRPAEVYLPELHGRVFTRTEILALVAARGMPEEHWEVNLPPDLAPYIEAQVWNLAALAEYA